MQTDAGPGLVTDHEVRVGDARERGPPPESVDLVVTSPPYPMVEMWDDSFAAQSDAAAAALADADGDRAFEAMHALLDEVWDDLARALVPGGVACVDVGDATRRLDGSFQLYPNHARIAAALRDRGLVQLPGVLWRKPTNSAAKFMGSGMLPTNAYVTLEHEHVLVFRKGGPRDFDPGDDARYESAFFWEERNDWFSDVWTDLRGTRQALDDDARARSGAFPVTLPYRLVSMYSVYGDTVYDPFWGTGTTTLAAMLAGRNSLGVEREPGLVDAFADRVDDVPERSRARVSDRLAAHEAFVAERRAADDEPGYETAHYDTRVVTQQERRIRFYAAETVDRTEEGYRVTHEPV